MNMCICRNCGKEYEPSKSRAELRGYCSAKCQHVKAKQLGAKSSTFRSEYDTLVARREVGDVPVRRKK